MAASLQSEAQLIEAISAVLSDSSPRSVRWIGDDAAVVRAEKLAITSVDSYVEGVHFRRSTFPLAAIGHKAAAGALSDLAAMGVAAGELYVALGIPRDLDFGQVLELLQGMNGLAQRCGATISGGDLSRAEGLFVSVTAVGWAADENGFVARSGAQPGDLVAVTGELGGAGCGLALLECHDLRVDFDPVVTGRLTARQTRPTPQIELGSALRRAGASAMIDLSDGLAGDAAHVARASSVDITIEAAKLPLQAGVVEVAHQLNREPHHLAAGRGEDYELVATFAPQAVPAAELAAQGCASRLTWIGEVRSGDGSLSLVDELGHQIELAGYDHFRDS